MPAPRLCLFLLALSPAAAAQGTVYLDADSPSTGSALDVAPLVTDFGTITFNGEVRLTADPEFVAAGSIGEAFNIVSPGNCELAFDFDVSAISFIYGGNNGSISVEARDATGAIVDSFFQANTSLGQPAGPVTLTGAGIRSLYWEDPGFSFAVLDNISLRVDTIYLDADTPATGSNLDIAPLMTGFGAIRFNGEIVSFTDPDLTAAGSSGSVFDIVSPGNCELMFNFDVTSVTFLYGGNAGSINVQARDGFGGVVDSFFQASTSTGEPAGPVTLAGNGIRSLYWSDTGGSFAALDHIMIQVGSIYLDADTPATGSNLDIAGLATSYGTITFNGEVRVTADPEFAAAGSVGDVFDIVSPGNCELMFGFDVSGITFIYGGNAGSISVEARDGTGAVVDSFFQADTGAGQPAGPVMLGGAGIRSLYWEDPGGNFAPLDNISIQVGARGIGTPYCGPAVVNSTGSPATLSASGSAVVAMNDVTLRGESLPQNSFGYFLTSRLPGFAPNPGGSRGDLCLGGSIGRYVGPGQIQNAGGSGNIALTIDLTQHPQPTGFVSVMAGETWNFQAWYRDAIGGMATSNFTDGLRIAFR